MHIYKFRILLEDNEQFFREIDVKANQTFEEFHLALNASAGFDNSEMASFYICDSKWSKLREISLCDLASPDDEALPEEEDDDEDSPKNKKAALPLLTMCNTRLKDVIIDPHQRFIYVYDFLKMFTFYIELFKIKEAEAGKTYPLVVKSTGRIAPPPTPITGDEEDEDEEEDLLKDFDDMLDKDNETGSGELEGLYDDNTFN